MHVCSMIPILMIYIPIVFSPKIHGLLRLNPCTHGPNYDEIRVTLQFHPAFWNFDRTHSILTFEFSYPSTFRSLVSLPLFFVVPKNDERGTLAVSLARKTPKTHHPRNGNGRLMAVATDAPPKTKTKTESEEVRNPIRLGVDGCGWKRWGKNPVGWRFAVRKKGWLKLNPQGYVQEL